MATGNEGDVAPYTSLTCALNKFVLLCLSLRFFSSTVWVSSHVKFRAPHNKKKHAHTHNSLKKKYHITSSSQIKIKSNICTMWGDILRPKYYGKHLINFLNPEDQGNALKIKAKQSKEKGLLPLPYHDTHEISKY